MKAKAFVPVGMGGWMAMTIHITPTLLGGTGKGLMRRPKSLFNGWHELGWRGLLPRPPGWRENGCDSAVVLDDPLVEVGKPKEMLHKGVGHSSHDLILVGSGWSLRWATTNPRKRLTLQDSLQHQPHLLDVFVMSSYRRSVCHPSRQKHNGSSCHGGCN